MAQLLQRALQPLLNRRRLPPRRPRLRVNNRHRAPARHLRQQSRRSPAAATSRRWCPRSRRRPGRHGRAGRGGGAAAAAGGRGSRQEVGRRRRGASPAGVSGEGLLEGRRRRVASPAG